MRANTDRKLAFDLNEVMMDLSLKNLQNRNTDNIVNFEASSSNSRFVPIKLKPQEAARALKCQKAMLDFAHAQYLKSIGTIKEQIMHTMYNDAKIDYQEFLRLHKNDF